MVSLPNGWLEWICGRVTVSGVFWPLHCPDVPVCAFLKVSTAEDNGILLYNGDNDHIAVELYQGHVKVSYDPGSQPGHAIYR